MEIYKFELRFHWSLSEGSNKLYSSIGSDNGKLTIVASDNGLLPGRHQAIIWSNNG